MQRREVEISPWYPAQGKMPKSTGMHRIHEIMGEIRFRVRTGEKTGDRKQQNQFKWAHEDAKLLKK